jgi:hypothetical protein
MATRGRPKKLTDEDRTTHVRMKQDLAEMLRWVARVQNQNVADLVDPLLRPQIISRYAARLDLIQQLKAAEDAAAVAEGRDPGPPLPVVIVDGQRSDAPSKSKAKGKN